MIFSVLQADLINHLQGVARSCGVRPQLPVLGNILLSVEAGKLKLSATNLEIGVVKLLTVEIEEEGEVTVPAKTLVEVVGNLSGEKLIFESSAEVLTIKSTHFTSSMNGINPSEFPQIPLQGKEVVRLSPKTLVSSLPRVMFAAASDEGRPVLTGILTELKDSKLELVATDGYRLAHQSIPVDNTAVFRALIPKRTLEEISRLLSEEEADEVAISVSEDQNQIIFSFGTTQLSSRLIEGSYPAWEKIIPQSFKSRIILNKTEGLKALKLASVFSRTEANIVKLSCSEGKMIVASQAKELGSQSYELEVQFEGEDIEISFNTKFLTDALSAVGSTQVISELSGTLSAASIKPMGEVGLEYIVMPVNLN